VKKRFKHLPLQPETDRRRGNFQRYIDLFKLRLEIYFNTDWFILSIPMQWNHFQTEQLSIRFWKNVSNIYRYQPEIDRRHGNFSAWY